MICRSSLGLHVGRITIYFERHERILQRLWMFHRRRLYRYSVVTTVCQTADAGAIVTTIARSREVRAGIEQTYRILHSIIFRGMHQRVMVGSIAHTCRYLVVASIFGSNWWRMLRQRWHRIRVSSVRVRAMVRERRKACEF